MLTTSTAACNAATNAVTALLGSGAKLKFRLTGTLGAPGTAVSTLSLSTTPFANAVGGIAEANTITQDSSATGNASPVATATLETSGGTVVVHCSVTADSTGDISLTNGLTIAAGDIVTCTRLRYAALVDRTTSMKVGVNTNYAVYTSGATPFANLMWNAEYWQDKDDASNYWVDQDQHNVTNNTVPHVLVAGLASSEENLPAGTYTVRNPDGRSIGFGDNFGSPNLVLSSTGTSGYSTATSFTFTLSANSALGIFTNGNGGNTAGTIAGAIQVILPGHVTSWDAGDYFNSAWVSFQQNLGVQAIRTMDWLGTNTNLFDSWSEMPTLTKTSIKGFRSRYPLEIAIAAANRLKVPLWLNIPVRATDSWVSSAASLIGSTYTLPYLYVEYANEVWNEGNAAFAGQTNWVKYLPFTKITATASGTTFTKASHGLSNSQEIRPFLHKSVSTAAGERYGPGTYWLGMGRPVYVKVLTSNTFEIWADSALVAERADAGTYATQFLYVDPAEVGKTADQDANYGARAKEIWDILDAALGSGRVKTVIGCQNGAAASATARMSVTGVGARTNYVTPAPYFGGITMGAAVDRASGSLTMKFWTSSDTDVSAAFRVYTTSATPRDDEIKAGTGTGYMGGGVGAISYGARSDVAVTISNGSPAIVTWDTTAPPNDLTVSFSTTGALPTGVSAGTSYYVVNRSGNTFQLSLTPQSSAVPINTSSAGSGVHTTDIFYGHTAYIHVPAATGLTDTVNYACHICATDPDGNDWFWSQTIQASASADTVEMMDSYENQKLRTLLDIDGAVSSASDAYDALTAVKNAAQAINSSCEVVCYEGGNHQSYSRPAAITTWWEGFVESAEHQEVVRHYLYTAAAAECKLFMWYYDIGASGAWTLADSNYDTTDLRYVGVSKFAGLVPKLTKVAYSPVNAGDITSAPSLPYTVYTFSETNRSFEIVAGDNEGNYQIVGNTLKMVATTSINFAVSAVKTLNMRSTDGFTDDFFSLSINLGVAPLYESDARIAWDKFTDTDAAVMDPVIRLNTMGENSGSSTSATIDGSGWWDMNGVSAYGSPNAMTDTVPTNVPFGLLWVGKKDNHTATQTMIGFGSTGGSMAFRCFSPATNINWQFVDSSGTETYGPNYDWSDGNPIVAWQFYNGSGLTYWGVNQTYLAGYNGVSVPGTLAASLTKQVQVPESNAKHGAFELVSRSGMTITQWLAIVQKYQTAFSIP